MTMLKDAKKALRAYHASHYALRADIEAMNEYLSRSPEERARTRIAFLRWLRHHADMIAVHDRLEHEYFFPQLQKHQTGGGEFAEFLKKQSGRADKARSAIFTTIISGDDGQLAVKLQEYIREVVKRLDDEESIYVPLIMQHYTAEEYERVEFGSLKMLPMSKMSSLMPWTLSRLQAQEKAGVLSSMPWPVRVMYRVWWEPSYRKKYVF